MTESEKTLEARLVREVKALGGTALKFTSQFHRGIPDRIILMPGRKTTFAEMKSTGKKPTKLQVIAIDQLRKMGYPVRVIDSTESLNELINELRNEK